MIQFAGIRSDEVGLIVEHYPQRMIPERDYEVIEVPGRDGEVLIDKGNFKNYRQSYSVFIDADEPDDETYQHVARNVAIWLLSKPGYQRLEDSYDPEFYRMAYYSGGTNFSNFFNVYGRGTIEFSCAPRRFYKSGEFEQNLDGSDHIYSPSVFLAEPLYKITPSARTFSIFINSQHMDFKIDNSLSLGTIYVDVEKHTAKLIDGTNIQVTSGNYEDLRLGKENTKGTSNVSSLSMVPRWWTI